MEMIAKYPGKCSETGVAFRRGDTIDYDRETKKAKLVYALPRAKSKYAKTDYAIARSTCTVLDPERMR